MALVIATNGNGVEIADGSSAPVNFVNSVYRWYFHNDVLRLTAGPCEFFAAVGSVTVDGNTPNNEADLNTALGAVFPQSNGGGLADILVINNSADGNKIVDLADPVDNQDAATKFYVVSHIRKVVSTSNNYTIESADAGSIIEFNNASQRELNIGLDADKPLPVGVSFVVVCKGAGQVIVGGSLGVVINSLSGLVRIPQYGVAYLIKTATDEWYLSGDLIVEP